jgi:predicted transcriptional regulator of viral defense system
MTSYISRLLVLGKDGPFRASDLADTGVPRSYLGRWEKKGVIERLSRGLYRLVEVQPTELGSVAEVARRVPSGVICLLTALQIHDLTSEVPHAVWLMIPTKGHRPQVDFVQTEIVYASGPALTHGVEQRLVEGVQVRLTNPAKTVADCFRYRNHIGMETAYTALRDYLRAVHGRRSREYTIPGLIDAAKADRIYSVMRPSLEAMVV